MSARVPGPETVYPVSQRGPPLLPVGSIRCLVSCAAALGEPHTLVVSLGFVLVRGGPPPVEPHQSATGSTGDRRQERRLGAPGPGTRRRLAWPVSRAPHYFDSKLPTSRRSQTHG